MDRISGLSDELLVKILLFVPTKVAVSTSILSKRWEYLWMWLPKLDYGRIDCSESECEKLRCFLVRNLPLHRAPVIESFRLRVGCSCFKPENIHMWVLTAVSHFLRELKIVYESDSAELDMLPSNSFTCKSLVILKLAGDIILDVPRMVSLPSLKTLRLQKVMFFNGETLQRLLSNCPILEDLMVDLHDYDDTGKLSIVVPSLQSLSLFIPYRHEIDGFMIETPSLKYFKLRDDSWHDHYSLIGNMPFLVEAYVDVDLPVINSVIRSITSVKRLTICSQDMLDEGFVFNQLEHLEVCLCTLLFSNQLVRLLNASSKLKRLDISLTDGHVPRDMDDWNQPSTVPECLLSSLQSLNWLEYTGEPQERDIVVYILKHALHLKTATITLTESDFTKLDMIKELARSSRASTTCELMFD
ncbi:unnamed protein product [Brassica rapa]|uniref:FBD domain-containing protein n=1 Tax=Brassica campestris TaxID=3711 RepID=A0A8D9G2C2_BRACM|nr:unnamed protein product [Brassica rapa]